MEKTVHVRKGYSEECAEYMAQRLIDLIDHMQYGYALSAFHKQGTIFKMVKATLIPYENFFHRFYEMERIESTCSLLGCRVTGLEKFPVGEFIGLAPRLLIINHLSFNH